MALHIGRYGDVLKTSYFNVLRTLVEDVPWRYIEDHMGTFIEGLFGTSSGRPQDLLNFAEWVQVTLNIRT